MIKQEQSMNNELFEKLAQFVDEAEISRKELYEESMKRKKAEKEAIGAIRRVSLICWSVDDIQRRLD